ncbi:MAG: hypothetical protein QNJ90_08910, partial [Planctomycetota bacterium]|nr:hypothetical protein [Planctomycetota bacterium]
MRYQPRSPAARAMACCGLLVLMLLPGACGNGGGDSFIQLVGGILRPNANAYRLTQTTDTLLLGAGTLPEAGGLPLRVDLRRDGVIAPVRNQRWNSCVAWTLGYTVMSAMEARLLQTESGDRSALDMTDRENWFAPDYIYSQRDGLTERERLAPGEPVCFETDGELGCMRPEQALKVLIEGGCSKWTWMCSAQPVDAYRTCDPTVNVLENLKSRRAWGPAAPGADDFKPGCYVRFGALDEGRGLTIRDMQAWLNEKRTPIAIVVKMTTGWVTYRGGNRARVITDRCFTCDVTEERGVCLDAFVSDLGSQHMMSIIGYDDTWPSRQHFPDLPAEKQGSFLVLNQWGAKWGDDGLMWIPYSELNRIFVAGYGLLPEPPPLDPVGAPAPGGQPQALVCSQDEEGRWINLFEDDDVPENLGVPPGGGLPAPVEITATELVVGTDNDREIGAVVGGQRDDADWFTYETTLPNQRLVLCMCHAAGPELIVRLTDAQQRTLAVFRDDGLPFKSFTPILCEPGRYFLKVTTAEPLATRLYRLTLESVTTPLPGEDICDAIPLSLSIPDSGTNAWWKYVVDETGVYEVTFSSIAATLNAWRGVDPAQISYIASAESGSTSTTSILTIPAIAGEILYFQGVGFGEPRESFSLQIDRLDAPPPPGETPGSATPLVFNAALANPGDPLLTWTATAAGFVARPDDAVQYYRFVAPAGTEVEVCLSQLAPGNEMFLSAFVEGESMPQARVSFGEDLCLTINGRLGCPEVLLIVQAGELSASDYLLTATLEFDENPARDGRMPENPRTLRIREAVQGALGGADNEDWARIDTEGAAGEEFILVLTGACAELDFQVLDDATGGLVALTDAGSFGVAQRRRVRLPRGGGPFWARVYTETEAPAEYELNLFDLAQPRARGGADTPAQAEPLTLGVARADSVGCGDDPRDFFRVTADGPAGGKLTVTVSVTGSKDPLRVHASDDLGLLCGGGAPCSAENTLTLDDVPAGTELTIMVERVA